MLRNGSSAARGHGVAPALVLAQRPSGGSGRRLLTRQPGRDHNLVKIASPQPSKWGFALQETIGAEHEERLRPGRKLVQFGKNLSQTFQTNLPDRIGVSTLAKIDPDQPAMQPALVDGLSGDADGPRQFAARNHPPFSLQQCLLGSQPAQSSRSQRIRCRRSANASGRSRTSTSPATSATSFSARAVRIHVAKVARS